MSWDYLSMLFRFGYKQQAYDMIVDPEVRWGRMMKEGFKIIWEGFEDIESHSHAWNAYPLRLMQEHLLGVKCIAPGFKEAVIEPFFPEGINTLEGDIHTPQGLLSVKLEKTDSGIRCECVIPRGMVVTFRGGNTPGKALTEGRYVFTA